MATTSPNPGATYTPPATSSIGGFSINRPQRRRRLVMSLAGLDKCGKTHQALSAPGPIACANTDTGLEGVVEKFQKAGKVVYSKDYRVVVQPGADINATATAAAKVWEDYKSDMRAAWKSPLIRTTVADTESDTYQLIRLARFGKLTQVMPHHYGPVYTEYANFWNEIYDTDKNLVLLRKMKYGYDEATKRRTNELEQIGYREMNYIVQVNAVAIKDPAQGFGIRVINCRQNSTLDGCELYGEMATFQQLAMLVFPDSDEKDWV